MSQVILDLGSGRSTHNDIAYTREIIDSIASIDTKKHEIILKFQLFQDAPPNIPLRHEVFSAAYWYALKRGYKVTASVFDEPSLEFLLHYDVPFVKIACRSDKYHLIGYVPRNIPVYASWYKDRSYFDTHPWSDVTFLTCIPEYPALLSEYEKIVELGAVSDHTVGLELWHKFHPLIWERHFVLKREKDNPDAGPFACTPSQLAAIL